MTPEDAMKQLKAGEKVVRKKPKAHATERKKAWKVGDKVRELKRPPVIRLIKGFILVRCSYYCCKVYRGVSEIQSR